MDENKRTLVLGGIVLAALIALALVADVSPVLMLLVLAAGAIVGLVVWNRYREGLASGAEDEYVFEDGEEYEYVYEDGEEYEYVYEDEDEAEEYEVEDVEDEYEVEHETAFEEQVAFEEVALEETVAEDDFGGGLDDPMSEPFGTRPASTLSFEPERSGILFEEEAPADEFAVTDFVEDEEYVEAETFEVPEKTEPSQLFRREPVASRVEEPLEVDEFEAFEEEFADETVAELEEEILGEAGMIDETKVTSDDAIIGAAHVSSLSDVATEDEANAETREILGRVAALLEKYE